MRAPGLKLLAVALVVAMVYTVLGALAGAFLLEHGLRKWAAREGGSSLVIKRVMFNPFTLAADLEWLQISDKDGRRFLTLDSARLDFSISTLLERRPVFSEILLEKPEWSAEITRQDNGLRRMFCPLSAACKAGDARYDLRVERLTVKAGTVFLRKGGIRHAGRVEEGGPPEMSLSGINLQVSHYDGQSEEPTGLLISTTINESAKLDVSGHLVPLGGALVTNIDLEGLELAHLSPLVDTLMGTMQLTGTLGADGLLKRSGDDWHFSGQLEIQRLAASAAPDRPPLFAAGKLRAVGAEIDAWPLRASARFMELRQPRLELDLGALTGAAGKHAGEFMPPHQLLGVFGPLRRSNGVDAAGTQAWPLAIGALEVTDASVSLVDPRLVTPLRIHLDQVSGGITSHAALPGAAESTKVNMRLTGTVGETGSWTLASMSQLDGEQVDSGGGPKNDRVIATMGVIELQHFDAVLLSDYFAEFTSREIVSGQLNLDLRYQIEVDRLAVTSRVSLHDFLPREVNRSNGLSDLPLELAVALLEDPEGEIRFQLPILERGSGSAVALGETISAALAGFISTMADRPFDVLAALAGTGEMTANVVDFEPGSAAITPVADQQLRALSVALLKRPSLGLRATGGHALQADFAAMARQQIQLHVALAASTRPNGRPEQATVDLSEPKVQAVLEEFAAARLDSNELAALRDGYDPGSEKGVAAEFAAPEAYYEALFAALVDKERVSENALRQLARYRVQSVIRHLESLGISVGRLQYGGTAEESDKPVTMEVFVADKSKTSDDAGTGRPHQSGLSGIIGVFNRKPGKSQKRWSKSDLARHSPARGEWFTSPVRIVHKLARFYNLVAFARPVRG